MENLTDFSQNPLHHPHDSLFKMTMEVKEIAEDFLREHLSEDIKARIDFSTLRIENNSFTDSILGKSHADVLFSAKFDDEAEQIWILVEHQSDLDRHMSYRLQKYANMILGNYLAKNPNCKYLPMIIPLIFYTCKKSYNIPKSFFGLFTKPDFVKKFLFEENQVIDISHTPDENFLGKSKLSAIYYIFKHIKDKNLSTKLPKIKQDLKRLSSQYYIYFKQFFSYTINNMDDPNHQKVVKLFVECATNEEQKGDIMNVAKRIEDAGKEAGILIGREEGIGIGREEGKQEGTFLTKLEIARALLSTGQSIEYISRVTGLSVEEVNGLLL